MTTIYKYPIKPSREIQEITLPFGSRFLSVIEQDMQIVLYCIVGNPDISMKTIHKYIVVGTGWDIEFIEDGSPKFIGTVKQGPFVWHVFEIEYLPF